MLIPMYVIKSKNTREVYVFQDEEKGIQKEAKYFTYEEAIRMLFILGAKYYIVMEKTELPREIVIA